VRTRELLWDGCVNVRDLGGLPTADGAATRYGAVVRADNLSTLSEKGRRQMLAYGVKRVIDLRWIHERNEDPQLELGVEVLHLPLFGDQNERREADRQLLERIRDHAESRRVMYLEHLEVYGERFATAVAAVASAPEGCVVVHCAAGVDRTGLVAALLLRLAHVSIDDVSADFGLSRDNWIPHIHEWIEETADEREREFRRFLAAMPQESMRGVLEEVELRYGGAEGYLRASGLPEDDVHRIRARLHA
jgi:protein tyrosine/serine phosphatase